MQPQSDHINLFIDLRYMLCAVKPGGFSSMVAWPDPGGGGGVLGVTGPPPPPPPPPSTAIYKCRSIRISFRFGGSRSIKMAIPFFLGGGGGEGGGCRRKSKPWGRLCLF